MKKNRVILFITSLLLISCGSTVSSSNGGITNNSNNENSEWKKYEEVLKVEKIVDDKAYSDNDNRICVEQTNNSIEKTGALNFFQINDTHGALDSTNNVTGIDHVSTLMKDLENKNGDYINILGGDIFQGGWLSNQTHGKAFVDVLNQMNFNCFVIGNHEFDWGLENIATFKDGDLSNGELNIPFLGANIYYNGTDTHPNWLDPYTIVNSNGYKVGIIGIIGEGQYSDISTDKSANYEFKNTTTVVKKYTKLLRQEKNCDAVVIATHDYSTTTNNVYASYKDEYQIDAIFCAHTHESVEDLEGDGTGRMVPVVQSYTKNGSAGTIKLEFKETGIESSINHYMPKNYDADLTITNYLKDNYGSIITSGEEVINTTSTNLAKMDIGKMATEYMTKSLDVDGAVINQGGVRATINKGNITRSKILEIFPFDNRILLVRIDGMNAKNLIKSSSYYTYSKEDATSFVSSKTYTLAIIDFVYTYASSAGKFKNSTYKETGIVMRDNFIECVEKM